MPGAAFGRLEHGEFGFPVTQNVRLGAGEVADLADAEKELVRNLRVALCGEGSPGFVAPWHRIRVGLPEHASRSS